VNVSAAAGEPEVEPTQLSNNRANGRTITPDSDTAAKEAVIDSQREHICLVA